MEYLTCVYHGNRVSAIKCYISAGAVMSTSPVTWSSLEVLPLNEPLYPAFYDHWVGQETALQLRRHLHHWGQGEIRRDEDRSYKHIQCHLQKIEIVSTLW